METKRCPKCGEVKLATVDFFYKHSKGKLGLSSWCKECRKKLVNDNRHRWHTKERWRACVVCGKDFSTKSYTRATCSPECLHVFASRRASERYPDKKSVRQHLTARRKRQATSARRRLPDHELKRCIYRQYGIPFYVISDEMVQLKREQIMIYRELKEFKKEVHNGTTGKGNTGTQEFEKGLQNQED